MGQHSRDGSLGATPPSDFPAFFSFGMFIIDEIEYVTPPPATTSPPISAEPNTPNPKPKLTSLPGGAGLYALLGARLLSPPPLSHRLTWILDAGSDLPTSSPLLSQIRAWATSTGFRRDDTRLTTRAWNGYGSATDPDYRAFRYLTPKIRLDVPDLTPEQLACRSWHMVCSSARCEDILRQLEGRQKHGREKLSQGGGDHGARGVVVWEPIPDGCSPEELQGLQRALGAGDGGVQVVSPNAEELGRFFDDHTREKGQDEMVTLLIGWNAQNYLHRHDNNDHSGNDCVCVIREGKLGSSIYFPFLSISFPSPSSLSTQSYKIHLPAYHDATTAHQVIDPTGGGNTYLGAYALALGYLSDLDLNTSIDTDLRELKRFTPGNVPEPVRIALAFVLSALRKTRDAKTTGQSAVAVTVARHLTAGICACVAAGYAIEQTGVPRLNGYGHDYDEHNGDNDSNDNGDGANTNVDAGVVTDEAWNGQGVGQRIRSYLDRVGGEIETQLRTLTDTGTHAST